jgi:hypothetical protein
MKTDVATKDEVAQAVATMQRTMSTVLSTLTSLLMVTSCGSASGVTPPPPPPLDGAAPTSALLLSRWHHDSVIAGVKTIELRLCDYQRAMPSYYSLWSFVRIKTKHLIHCACISCLTAPAPGDDAAPRSSFPTLRHVFEKYDMYGLGRMLFPPHHPRQVHCTLTTARCVPVRANYRAVLIRYELFQHNDLLWPTLSAEK